jgi:asparagine synthase (glutamine-hydrolysing)
MCGIIGIVGKEAKEIKQTVFDRMLSCLAKRGPDDKGLTFLTETNPACILGQTRLSIIDLSPGGHQPMKDNAKNLTIVFNGEIYNYPELKKELMKKGHHFSSASDTEVILKAYSQYGHDCPKYLDGMFAFAIWDQDQRTLFMARDRFGKKPFYYAFDKNNNFIFASEVKAILQSELVKGEIDHSAIDDYLTLMYIPPTKSVYRNIHTLAPAEQAVLKNGVITKSLYWKLEDRPISMSYDEAKKEIKRLFKEAVRKRMIADVEIGSFLSGGVDSTLVTSYAQEFCPHPIKTFSVGYEDYINELPFANEANKKIGTDHYTLQAGGGLGDMIDELLKVIAYFDEPHADSSDFPQAMISQLASSKVKVALSGDGADELFLGYGWYWKHWHLPFFKRMKQNIFSNPFKGYIKNIQIFTTEEKNKLWKESIVNSDSFIPDAVKKSNLSPIKKINYFDLTTYLPGQLLTKVDRAGMMNSLEVRSPFLDYKLAEFVYNLPFEYKCDRKSGKIILKDILSEIMPKEFVYRRKQGFGAPVKQWLQKDNFKKLVYQTLGESSAEIYRMFNKEYVDNLLTDFYEKNIRDRFYQIWTLLCLELWMKENARK